MKKHAASIRARQNRGDEPLITMPQLNAAVRQLPHLHDMFVEELMKRVSHEDFNKMEPYLSELGAVFAQSITQCYYNLDCSNPHPETFSELRDRFTAGEEWIIQFLQSRGANLDEGAQFAFKTTYKHICQRLENSMMGQGIGEQSGQYLLQ